MTDTEAVVSVFDRSFLYGDGIFETIRLHKGQPVLWTPHLERLSSGASLLGIALPETASCLHEKALELAARNGILEGVLRVTISRGVGPRGYSPNGAVCPTLLLTVHPLPQADGRKLRWRLATSPFHLPHDSVTSGLKSANRILQVLARGEADRKGVNEAILTDSNGFAMEGAASNLFWIEDQVVCTPPLGIILPGVTRAAILSSCSKNGIAVSERCAKPERLFEAEGVFMSLSTWGVVEGTELDGRPLAVSPLLERVRLAYAGHCAMLDGAGSTSGALPHEA